jgi:hypothetical protein
MLTKQEIYTKVRKHLLTQNAKATIWVGSSIERCRYRDDVGRKCAIGCLIPDEKYNKAFESQSLHSSILLAAIGVPSDDPDLLEFLSKLQQIHDCYPVESWKERLDEFAARHGLKIEN